MIASSRTSISHSAVLPPFFRFFFFALGARYSGSALTASSYICCSAGELVYSSYPASSISNSSALLRIFFLLICCLFPTYLFLEWYYTISFGLHQVYYTAGRSKSVQPLPRSRYPISSEKGYSYGGVSLSRISRFSAISSSVSMLSVPQTLTR